MMSTRVVFQEPALSYLPEKTTLTLTINGDESPVVIFSEMFNVLVTRYFTPEVPEYYYSRHKKFSAEIAPGKSISAYYSPELINDINALLSTGIVEWKWLSNLDSNVHKISQNLNLPASLEHIPLTKDISSTFDATANPKGASIMNEYLNKKETRPFIWVTPKADSLYYHPEILGTLAVPYIVVNPHQYHGVSRHDWKEIIRFLTENTDM